MCGRFTLYSKAEVLESRFDAKFADGEYSPSYNTAPDAKISVILNESRELISTASWRFVPSWIKPDDDKKYPRPFNARGEAVATSGMFRGAFRGHRCLILTDGFYEWDRKGDVKVPYYIRLRAHEPFAFGGIWDVSTDKKGRVQTTTAIVTIDANSLMRKIHDRMPVIVDEIDEERWLDGDLSVEGAQGLIKSCAAEEMEMFEVSKRVNNASFNGPAAIEAK